MMIKIKNKINKSIIVFVTTIVALICIIPFIAVIAISLSSNNAIISQRVTLLPVEFNLTAYLTVFRDKLMINSLLYTIVITVLFTVVSMIFTICVAYPLTKKSLKGRSFFLFVIVITMYFSGGIIPDYILVKNLHLLDTTWSLILPGLISVYNMIILKTF